MKATLNDLLNAKGVSEPLREAVKVLQRENAELREALEHPSYEEENRLRAERDALRAKIELMEQQEPYCWTTSPPSGRFSRFKPEVYQWISNGWETVPLYLAHGAAPGAQSAPSVPEGFAWPECPKRRQSHVLFDDGYEEGWAACIAAVKAMLAAAPNERGEYQEAKP